MIEFIEKELTNDLVKSINAGDEGKKKKKDKRKRKLKRAYGISEIKVADITFAFDNQKLIASLRKRGNSIALNKFDEVNKENEKINQLFKDEYTALTVPTSAFITFEEEEGASWALKCKDDRQLLDQ